MSDQIADDRRLLKTAPTARHFQVHPATIEGWLSKGLIKAYRVGGAGPILFDLDEIERALKLYGPQKMRDGRRRGAKGRVVPLAIVVTEAGDR